MLNHRGKVLRKKLQIDGFTAGKRRGKWLTGGKGGRYLFFEGSWRLRWPKGEEKGFEEKRVIERRHFELGPGLKKRKKKREG